MFDNITADIENILYPYVETQSTTGTNLEVKAENFLMNYFENIDYFKRNPKFFGAYKIDNDPLERSVCYAMIKGEGKDTVVFIHHYDVVDTEDFRLLRPFAYSPKALSLQLLKIKETLNQESKTDLESGEFLLGRGTADMKGGGSIQLALLKKYSEIQNIKGNVLLIAVPDEENLSVGMRGAVKLLDELKNQYNLNYLLMINSEPHQRKNKEIGVFSEGSVGKLMPFIYVRGYLSHIGKVFEGFNPTNLLCEIVRRTELNLELSDSVNNETSPPPTWLYLKDNKQHYDVSMPLSAAGCFSVLTLKKSPGEILDKVSDICNEAFDTIILQMNQNYSKFKCGMGEEVDVLPWRSQVITFTPMLYLHIWEESNMLKVVDLNVFYGGIHALKGVTIEVNKGEIVTIIGSNGAGKSTLLNSICGILKPRSGEIIYKDEKIITVPHKIVKRGISHVPEGRLIFANLSVKDNLMLGAYLRKDHRVIAEDMEKVYELFPILKERQKQISGTLSGGEQQMLAMGRGLMSNPDIILLDEPSLGLAPLLVKTIFEIIIDIQKMGKTILLVEQNAYKALKIASRAYVLEQGVITLEGNAVDIAANPKIQEAYLGSFKKHTRN